MYQGICTVNCEMKASRPRRSPRETLPQSGMSVQMDGYRHHTGVNADRTVPDYWNSSPRWRHVGADLCCKLCLYGRQSELTQFPLGEANPKHTAHESIGFPWNSPSLFPSRTRHLLSCDRSVHRSWSLYQGLGHTHCKLRQISKSLIFNVCVWDGLRAKKNTLSTC